MNARSYPGDPPNLLAGPQLPEFATQPTLNAQFERVGRFDPQAAMEVMRPAMDAAREARRRLDRRMS